MGYLAAILTFRKTQPQHSGLAPEDGPGGIEIVFSLLGNDFSQAGLFSGNGVVGTQQFCRHAVFEGVGENLAVSQDQDITKRGVALNLLVQHSLQGDQVVDENLVRGVQGDGLGRVLHLAHHRFTQGGTVLPGDQKGNNQPADDYQGADRQE